MGLFKKIAKAVLPAAGAFVGSKIPFIGASVGTALGTGAAGAIGSNDAQAFAEDQWNANAALQREFAQHGIRWRVEDAKAAGVHPLYALGAGGAAAAPISMSVAGGEDWSSRMGQDLGRAVTAQMDPHQRRLQEAQLAVLESEAAKNNALALAALGSKGATNNQPGQVPFPDVRHGPVDMTSFYNQAVVKPVEVASMTDAGTGIAAGPAAPGMYLHMFGGQPVLLPGKDVSEALESLGESALAMAITARANVSHLGEAGAEEAVRRVLPYGDFIGDAYRGSRRARDVVVRLAEAIRDAVPAGEVRGRISSGKLARRWLRERGLSEDTVWTGRGPAPWNRY